MAGKVDAGSVGGADGTRDPLIVPARRIPPPSTISSQARDALANPRISPRPPRPALSDKAAWREFAARGDANLTPMLSRAADQSGTTVETVSKGGVTVYRATPGEIRPEMRGRAVLNFHGGAFAYLSGQAAMLMTQIEAGNLGCEVWGIDYRVPPDHPFPAAIEDGVAVWLALLDSYSSFQLAISGQSAGGNLAAAVVLKLRDQGAAMPVAVGLMSPEIDLTESGDSFNVNLGVDPRLASLATENALYAEGRSLTDPLVSPLYADFARGFPPTFISSGTRDLFLSNAVLIHRKLRRASIRAELHIWEAMPHGGFGGAPEDREIVDEWRSFFLERSR